MAGNPEGSWPRSEAPEEEYPVYGDNALADLSYTVGNADVHRR